jgi:hypothetical protein
MSKSAICNRQSAIESQFILHLAHGGSKTKAEQAAHPVQAGFYL